MYMQEWQSHESEEIWDAQLRRDSKTVFSSVNLNAPKVTLFLPGEMFVLQRILKRTHYVIIP